MLDSEDQFHKWTTPDVLSSSPIMGLIWLGFPFSFYYYQKLIFVLRFFFLNQFKGSTMFYLYGDF